MTDDARVLIVEDDRSLADLYATVLNEKYETLTAYSGEEALDAVDNGVDCVLLDRKMPGLSGGEVLDRLRERGFDQPVGMLTAVIPDWDVIEMGFDDYANKPVGKHGLKRFVERLLVLGDIDDQTREYVAKTVTKAALEGEKDPSELDREAFDALADDLAETGAAVGDPTADLSPRETELILETITRNLGTTADNGIGES
jgi:Response regulators consisting of a CheY-like receiver domain and a winged-helix DNA-binding domain